MGYPAAMRRLTATLVLVAAVASGCGPDPGPTKGGEPSAAEKEARLQLVRANSDMNDLELAHLCPALYPADILKDPKKYGFDKQEASKQPSRQDLQLAARAGCGKPVPIGSKDGKPAATSSSTTTPAKPDRPDAPAAPPKPTERP